MAAHPVVDCRNAVNRNFQSKCASNWILMCPVCVCLCMYVYGCLSYCMTCQTKQQLITHTFPAFELHNAR